MAALDSCPHRIELAYPVKKLASPSERAFDGTHGNCMNTGTPLDLTPFGSILSAAGILYWVVAIGLLTLALRKPATWQGKGLASCVVLAVFGWLPATYGWEQYRANKKLSEAVARFEELCKTAGPKIYQIANEVDGISLENPRPELSDLDKLDKNWFGAGLADERNGDSYIRSFLEWEDFDDKRNDRGVLVPKKTNLPGYRFVDVLQPNGGYIRYTLDSIDKNILIKKKIEKSEARYLILLEGDGLIHRDYWIAGEKVKVIDTESKKILGESQWFSMDFGQGSREGFRRPWDSSRSCPSHIGWVGGRIRFFVDSVAIPVGRN